MGNPKNLKANGNANNSTNDDRVIWEDGTWAIIEAGDCWDGLARSKTRDNIGDAVSAPCDPGLTTLPGPASIAAKKLVKVALADILAKPQVQAPRGPLPKAKDYKSDPVAPPSPFSPKPWQTKDAFPGSNVPEFPHLCSFCGGRYYKGLNKNIHESTEHGPGKGECPQVLKMQEDEAKRDAKRRRSTWP